MKEQLFDILFRYGFSKEEFDSCELHMAAENRLVLSVFNTVSTAVLIAMTISEHHSSYAVPFSVLGVIFFTLGLFSVFMGGEQPRAMRYVAYADIMVSLSCQAYIGTYLTTDAAASSFFVILAAFPAVFIARPLYTALIMSGNVAVFIHLSLMLKDSAATLTDIQNSIVYFIWGIGVHYFIGKIRIGGILNNVRLEQVSGKAMDVLENIPCGIAVIEYGRDGRNICPTYFGGSWSDIFGFTEEESLEMSRSRPFDLVHPDDRDRVAKEFFQGWDCNDFSVRSYRMCCGSGGYKWVDADLKLKDSFSEKKVFYAIFRDVSKEMELRRELEESEQRFKAAIENSDVYIWEYNIQNGRAVQSDKSVAVFGLPKVMDNYPESLMSMGMIVPESEEAYIDLIKRLKAGEQNASAEIAVFDKHKKIRWHSIKYWTEYDELGHPMRSVGCSRDITQQKELEFKYREQFEYRQVLSKSAVASLKMNLTQNIVFEPSSENTMMMENMSVPTVDELLAVLGENIENEEAIEEFAHIDSCAKLMKLYSDGDRHINLEHFDRKLKHWIKTMFDFITNPFTKDVEVFVTVLNINERRQVQEIVNAVATLYYDYIGWINPETGEYNLFAQGSGKPVVPPLCGSNYEKTASDYANKYVHEEDRHLAAEGMMIEHVKRELAHNPLYEIVLRCIDGDGSIGIKKVSFSYLNKHKDPLLLITRSDVTALVREEQEKKELLAIALSSAEQASRAKSAFLSRMSHEMRTPMNAIIGLTSLAASDADKTSGVADALRKINAAAKYLLMLINDILDMSRIENNMLILADSEFDLNKFLCSINSIIASQADLKGVAYQFLKGPGIGDKYIGDEVKLQQVLLNVVSNAVKFTPEGGTVSMLAEYAGRCGDRVSLRFTVRDNGVGIGSDFLPHIFEPFAQEYQKSTSAYGGTGLGLAISKNIVDLMDGKIEARSVKGEGSVFVIEVKLRTDEKELLHNVSEPKAAERNCDFFGKRALLVEDQPLNVEVARRLLEKKGFTVDVAWNGLEAVTKFAQAEDAFYDVILMDVRMPIMDGLSAARRIRELKKRGSCEIPIIAMTANVYEDDLKKSKESGMNAHLGKPIEPDVLYRTLTEQLSKPVF